MIPQDLQLETDKILLRPVQASDEKTFLQLAQEDADMWMYFTLNLGDAKQLNKWMQMLWSDAAAKTRCAFTIIDKLTGKIAGSSSMGNISYHDKRLEIGWSWLGKGFRSTGINRHAKFAMMKYAFEVQHFERVEFKTDQLNARARKGLENIGGVEEGVLRSHMTMWNNRRRSSVFYSVIKDEWPGVRQRLFHDIN